LCGIREQKAFPYKDEIFSRVWCGCYTAYGVDVTPYKVEVFPRVRSDVPSA